MKEFWFAVLVWLLISLFLGLGIFLAAVKGSWWVLIITTAVLVGAIGRVCASSH